MMYRIYQKNLKRGLLTFAVFWIALLSFSATVTAVTPGQMLVQVNPFPASVVQGNTLTVTGIAPYVSAPQLQVWVVRGDAAWVTGTSLQFNNSFTITIDTGQLQPGAYGMVIAAPFNGQYPVTFDSAEQSAVITTTGQPIIRFSSANTMGGPAVAQAIVSTCANVGADINCVPLSFTVLPPATQQATVTSTAPVTKQIPISTRMPFPLFAAVAGMCIAALLQVSRKQ